LSIKDQDTKREYQRKWKANRRKAFFENKKCTECGSIVDLELHHVNPKDKTDHRIWSWSKERQEKELKKCIVLCKECHLKITIKEKTTPVIHGNSNTYKRSKCRCDLCTEAAKIYQREWRKNRGNV